MKKLSSIALLLLALTATAATAEEFDIPEHSPTWDRQYNCTYPQGPWTNESTNYGWSIFTAPNPINFALIYAIEVYKSFPHPQDNRRVAFAKPQNFCGIYDPHCLDPDSVPVRTKWEFTVNNTVQCKNTVVRNYGRTISFSDCSNGKTRVCSY